MYVTYDITTGAISGWSSKLSTPQSGYAVVESSDFNEANHRYYNEDTGVFSGPTDEEKNDLYLQGIRILRNKLLSESDWTQANDSPLSASKRTEWATYRQALRDLPSNTTDPSQPVWPTPPE